ncbi:DUF4153 domain-containing protein [Pulveribacter suum]|uniref:DUF4153 domain-containing protein n=1 Tax=Pulveribacter suum TaxID=2116657 RepID=A0A2P1NJJ0_9BURK|nr:DUF4153 domain-containing protein [Pulveribacter suum]AVP57248.1 DUF4153 domain-containing protein [Pulveribacter suum]
MASHPSARLWIAAWALAQGAALWSLHRAHESLAPAVLWPLYVLALALPLTLQLLAAHRGRQLLWALAGALCLTLAAAAAYVGHQVVDDQRGAAQGWSLALLAACWFVLLPFIEQRLATRHWARDYAQLFAASWRHAFQLQVAALFALLFWALLMLLAALFKVLGVTLFATLFGSRTFIYLATPLAFGAGLALFATREEALEGFWRTLLHALGSLLPLACLIALLFALALPVRGLAPLWATGRASVLMLGLMAWIVFLFNVAWSDGTVQGQRFGPLLRRLVEAGLLSLPLYALLCAYALGLRVAQHGWSVDRVWAALAVLLMAVYALGYAAAAVLPRRGAPWMALTRRVNVAAALLGVALALLTCTPLLEPARIAVASQLARLAAQRIEPDAFDYHYLRWDAGRAGHAALERLSREQEHPQAAQIRLQAQRTLAATSRYLSADLAPGDEWTPERLRAHLRPHPQGTAPDAGWLAFALVALEGRTLTLDCTEEAPCPLLSIDMDGDGQPEQVLLDGHASPVFTREGGHWREAGRLHGRNAGRLHGGVGGASLEQGVRTQAPRWHDLLIGGERYSVRASD